MPDTPEMPELKAEETASSPQRLQAPPEQDEYLSNRPGLDFLISLVRTNKWPGWALLLLGIFTLVPDWESRFAFWLSALHQVGGSAAMLVHALPFIGLLSIAMGFAYLLCIVWQEDIATARPWMPLAGWTIFIVFLVTLGSLALFADFVVSSKIPEAVHYFEMQRSERSLSSHQLSQLKVSVEAIKDDIPTFPILAGREPETLQYAEDLLGALKADGLKVMQNGKEQDYPEPTDLYSPSWRGVIIMVKYRDAPVRPAVLLSKALNSAGISTAYISSPGSDNDALEMIVGLK